MKAREILSTETWEEWLAKFQKEINKEVQNGYKN